MNLERVTSTETLVKELAEEVENIPLHSCATLAARFKRALKEDGAFRNKFDCKR